MVESGESFSKAEVVDKTSKVETMESKPRVQLPDVPTKEPDDDGPATKKQKPESEMS
jgi:O-acetyl-ADP-ribose deacetylase